MTRLNLYRIGILVLTAWFFSGCRLHAQNKTHQEDLSGLRPVFHDTLRIKPKRIIRQVPATHTVNARLDSVLDSIARFNLSRTFADGFTIQVYSGTSKEEAMNTKKKMMEQAEDLMADLQYNQPKFRVKSGNYYTRIEAQRDLVRIRRLFPNAILVPEKIPVR